jgi:hypothetical protein
MNSASFPSIWAVVHDCWPAYFKDQYLFGHTLCNAHLLRECRGITEHDGQVLVKPHGASQTGHSRVSLGYSDSIPITFAIFAW